MARPDARSESIITSLRFQRSTSAPAIGLSSIVGPKENSPTSASVVACPVSCHAQMVMAKAVMPEPSSDANCPAHTRVNPAMPAGRVRITAASIRPRRGPARGCGRRPRAWPGPGARRRRRRVVRLSP